MITIRKRVSDPLDLGALLGVADGSLVYSIASHELVATISIDPTTGVFTASEPCIGFIDVTRASDGLFVKHILVMNIADDQYAFDGSSNPAAAFNVPAGFVPEDSSKKNQPNGYLGLDADGKFSKEHAPDDLGGTGPASTDALPEGSTNLYYNDVRVRSVVAGMGLGVIKSALPVLDPASATVGAPSGGEAGAIQYDITVGGKAYQIRASQEPSGVEKAIYLFDGAPTTHWMAQMSAARWVDIELPDEVTLDNIVVAFRGDGYGDPSQAPRDYGIYSSPTNDFTGDVDSIGVTTNQAGWAQGEKRSLGVTQARPSRYYRFYVNQTNGDPVVCVGALELNIREGGSSSNVRSGSLYTAALATIANGDDLVAVKPASAQAVTVKLPAAPANWEQHTVVDAAGYASEYPITIDGNGKNINGSPAFTLDVARGAITLVYNTAEWMIV